MKTNKNDPGKKFQLENEKNSITTPGEKNDKYCSPD